MANQTFSPKPAKAATTQITNIVTVESPSPETTSSSSIPRFGYANVFDVKFLTDLADFTEIESAQWRDHSVEEIRDMIACARSLRSARDEIKARGFATRIDVRQCILVTFEILCKAGVAVLDVREK